MHERILFPYCVVMHGVTPELYTKISFDTPTILPLPLTSHILISISSHRSGRKSRER